MGAWGPGLFQDDVAEDVRDDFRTLIGDGATGEVATDEVLRRHSEGLDDTDDGPIIWLALAATQVKLGRLEDRVRVRALDLIRSGADLERWEFAADRRRRKAVLEKLEAELTGPQRPPMKVRPPLRTTTPLTTGDLAAYRMPDGRAVILRVLARVGDERDNYPIVDLPDCAGTEAPEVIAGRPPRRPVSKVGREVFCLTQHRKGEFPAERVEIRARGLGFGRRALTPSLMFSWTELDKNLERDFGL